MLADMCLPTVLERSSKQAAIIHQNLVYPSNNNNNNKTVKTTSYKAQ